MSIIFVEEFSGFRDVALEFIHELERQFGSEVESFSSTFNCIGDEAFEGVFSFDNSCGLTDLKLTIKMPVTHDFSGAQGDDVQAPWPELDTFVWNNAVKVVSCFLSYSDPMAVSHVGIDLTAEEDEISHLVTQCCEGFMKKVGNVSRVSGSSSAFGPEWQSFIDKLVAESDLFEAKGGAYIGRRSSDDNKS